MSTPPGRIVIQQYSEQWPSEFLKLKELLDAALEDAADRIDHIGSTSVPGLAAKDIIDVQVAVADLGDPRLLSALEELGCQATEITSDHVPPGDRSGPAGWEKRYFRPPVDWRPTHLHVRETGRPNYRYALLFRDYLRQSAAAAAAPFKFSAVTSPYVEYTIWFNSADCRLTGPDRLDEVKQESFAHNQCN